MCPAQMAVLSPGRRVPPRVTVPPRMAPDKRLGTAGAGRRARVPPAGHSG